jgi:MFS transporter, PAT family, beta-lactamase induction signal transducer AmpG
VNLLESKLGRIFLVTILYLTEGAPIGFIWWAMPTLLRQQNVAIESITSLTAILILPWIFKFVWAPLVDSLRNEKRGYKFWIFISQLFMGAALIPLIFISPQNNFFIWGLFLFIHSLSAATQDVSIDALVINVIAKNERGKLNGFMNAGMLIGRSLFGGGTLILAYELGLNYLIGLLVIIIFSVMTVLFFLKEPVPSFKTKNQFNIFLENFSLSFKSKNTWLAILFALTSAAAFEVAGGLAGPFLTDLNVSQETIGVFFALPVVVAMFTGGLIGGYVSDKINRKSAVRFFLFGFAAAVLVISVYNFIEPYINEIVFLSAYSVMYFFVGLFTASSYALFMDVTNPNIGGTQFSTYMAATNGCEAWTVWSAGFIIAGYGYSPAFILMSIVSLASLLLLKKIKLD